MSLCSNSVPISISGLEPHQTPPKTKTFPHKLETIQSPSRDWCLMTGSDDSACFKFSNYKRLSSRDFFSILFYSWKLILIVCYFFSCVFFFQLKVTRVLSAASCLYLTWKKLIIFLEIEIGRSLCSIWGWLRQVKSEKKE